MRRALTLVLLVGVLLVGVVPAPAAAQTTDVTAQEPQSAGEVWDNYYVFVSMVVLLFTVIGLWGKSLAVGSFLGYVAFARIATETQSELLISILYVTLMLVFVGFAFKLWRLEFGGE